jgi:acyl-CoA dehydrogenase
MCLTEPQAGSDLAAITTRAVPKSDHYLLSGRKIFITWGDHAMTSNIAHLVLARLPDAPQGTKGISLFVVPKYKLRADGTPGERNDVHPVSVEHKLGIHASPTCVMAFGDRRRWAYLIGKPNEGLAAMF